MTTRAPQWFENKYIAGAIHVIQEAGYRLKGLLNETAEVKGNQVTWKLAGTGEATPMSTSIEDRPVMNADRNKVEAYMQDWEANEYILSTDIEKMPESEQQVAQRTAGMAMGRLFDKSAMQMLDAAAGAIETLDVSAAAAPSIVDTMTATGRILAQGYNDEPVLVCALPQMVMFNLELYKEFGNSEWNGDQRPMMKMIGARTYKGVQYVPLPDQMFTIAGGNVDYYIWQKGALGMVPNYALKSRIDYVPEKKAYFCANTIGFAQAVLQAAGVRRIRSKLPTVLVRPAN